MMHLVPQVCWHLLICSAVFAQADLKFNLMKNDRYVCDIASVRKQCQRLNKNLDFAQRSANEFADKMGIKRGNIMDPKYSDKLDKLRDKYNARLRKQYNRTQRRPINFEQKAKNLLASIRRDVNNVVKGTPTKSSSSRQQYQGPTRNMDESEGGSEIVYPELESFDVQAKMLKVAKKNKAAIRPSIQKDERRRDDGFEFSDADIVKNSSRSIWAIISSKYIRKMYDGNLDYK